MHADFCRSRHCEPCMRSKAGKMAANLREELEKKKAAGVKFRFITLSVKHTEKPLAVQVKKMYGDFKKLRNSKEWKRSQTGGVFFSEIKFDPSSPSNRDRLAQGKRPLWHPHIHVISEGNFLDKFDLSRLWHKVTGDSSIVDIRQMENEREAAHYLSKYVTKSTSVAVWDDVDAAEEWITASRGLRTAATFGCWRGFRLLRSSYEPQDWIGVASLASLVQRARDGEVHALNILVLLRPPGVSEENWGGKNKPPS